MIRDEEIERLIKYAEGMGLTVIMERKPSPDAASWSLDGRELTIYRHAKSSKLDTVLALIHELGHHVWFIHEQDRKQNPLIAKAVARQDAVDEGATQKPIPKKDRLLILELERAGAAWWDTIYKETNLSFPKWRLELAKAFDLWMYEFYAEMGSFPVRRIRQAKYAELKRQVRQAWYAKQPRVRVRKAAVSSG